MPRTLIVVPLLLVLACKASAPPAAPSNRSVPVAETDPGAQYVGDPQAAVALTYWFDYQCPHCVTFAPILADVASAYGNRIVIHFKNFQLARHPDSRDAAIAAEAARRQGKFMAMYKLLIARSEQTMQQSMQALQQGRFGAAPAFTAKVLRETAAKLGLDLSRYDKDVADATAAGHVDGEYADGEQQGLEFVPAVFINGVLYEGEPTVEALSAAIDVRLARLAR